jgi:hypothetical protein
VPAGTELTQRSARDIGPADPQVHPERRGSILRMNRDIVTRALGTNVYGTRWAVLRKADGLEQAQAGHVLKVRTIQRPQ